MERGLCVRVGWEAENGSQGTGLQDGMQDGQGWASVRPTRMARVGGEDREF